MDPKEDIEAEIADSTILDDHIIEMLDLAEYLLKRFLLISNQTIRIGGRSSALHCNSVIFSSDFLEGL